MKYCLLVFLFATSLFSQDGAKFKCEGKKYCSQMVSCEEAMFYLKNCKGVKIDGDRDGIPCERQWCGHLTKNKNMYDFKKNVLVLNTEFYKIVSSKILSK